MNLIRFNQYPTFGNLFEEFNRNLRRDMGETSGDLPAVNIKEEKDKFILEMAAPGMKKEDFKINLDNYQLTITVEHEDEKKKKEDNYTRKEFSYTSFSRSFTLPETIDIEKIKGDYKDGILMVSLPKKEEKQKLTRQIKIS